MKSEKKINEKNIDDVYFRIVAYAMENVVTDDDGNLDFEETAYAASVWAHDSLDFGCAYDVPLESSDDWYDFIVSRCVSLREDLENFVTSLTK